MDLREVSGAPSRRGEALPAWDKEGEAFPLAVEGTPSTSRIQVHVQAQGSSKVKDLESVLSTPELGEFSTRDVAWEEGKLPMEKGGKFAWIPRDRLDDFVEGIRSEHGRRFYRRSVKDHDIFPGSSQLWSRVEQWHCECGPADNSLTTTDADADADANSRQSRKRLSRKARGASKKVGCPVTFYVRWTNPGRIRVVGASTDLVRLAWRKSEHTCADVTTHVVNAQTSNDAGGRVHSVMGSPYQSRNADSYRRRINLALKELSATTLEVCQQVDVPQLHKVLARIKEQNAWMQSKLDAALVESFDAADVVDVGLSVGQDRSIRSGQPNKRNRRR